MYLKRKDWNINDIISQLRSIHYQAVNPWNDGFTASGCKKDLFQLKCLIEDLYNDTPNFSNEEEWYQERTLELLKKNKNT